MRNDQRLEALIELSRDRSADRNRRGYWRYAWHGRRYGSKNDGKETHHEARVSAIRFDYAKFGHEV